MLPRLLLCGRIMPHLRHISTRKSCGYLQVVSDLSEVSPRDAARVDLPRAAAEAHPRVRRGASSSCLRLLSSQRAVIAVARQAHVALREADGRWPRGRTNRSARLAGGALDHALVGGANRGAGPWQLARIAAVPVLCTCIDTRRVRHVSAGAVGVAGDAPREELVPAARPERLLGGAAELVGRRLRCRRQHPDDVSHLLPHAAGGRRRAPVVLLRAAHVHELRAAVHQQRPRDLPRAAHLSVVPWTALLRAQQGGGGHSRERSHRLGARAPAQRRLEAAVRAAARADSLRRRHRHVLVPGPHLAQEGAGDPRGQLLDATAALGAGDVRGATATAPAAGDAAARAAERRRRPLPTHSQRAAGRPARGPGRG